MEQVAAAADEATPGRLGALGGRPGVVVDVRDLRKQYGRPGSFRGHQLCR